MTEATIERRSLGDIRDRIDEIDAAIVRLWAERNDLAAEAGGLKRNEGIPVYVHSRDLEVRDRFGEMCADIGVRRDVGRTVIDALMKTSYEAQGSVLGQPS